MRIRIPLCKPLKTNCPVISSQVSPSHTQQQPLTPVNNLTSFSWDTSHKTHRPQQPTTKNTNQRLSRIKTTKTRVISTPSTGTGFTEGREEVHAGKCSQPFSTSHTFLLSSELMLADFELRLITVSQGTYKQYKACLNENPWLNQPEVNTFNL